ncbi:MAG: PD40 domain-containing protein [Anaerolineae bacterium]|nr:PD40 domain-containing protein [Anaerolineae bacterium]
MREANRTPKDTASWPVGAWIDAPAQQAHDAVTGGAGNNRHIYFNRANTLYHPHPTFSPDGRQIIFCRRDEAGHNDVCLVRTPEEMTR